MDTPPDPIDVAGLFRRLAALEPRAFGEIATRFRDRLLPGARRRLGREPELRGLYDEEVAYQSALSLIWLCILNGDMDPPGGLDDYLRLARTIIGWRITAKARSERDRKRNPAPNEAPARRTEDLDRYIPDGVDVLACDLPTSEAIAIAEDQTRWLMAQLGSQLREVAEDGFVDRRTFERIAQKRGLSPRKVERMFQEIRAIWKGAVRRHR